MTGTTAGTASASFAGSRHLVRLVLRRDRVRLPLWLLGLGGMIASSAVAVPSVYDTPAKVAGYAGAVGASPVSYLMSGRQAGIDTLGGIVANEVSQIAQLGTCLMVMFLVVRHTRAEEESGRAELLRSTVLGRHAATLAGLAYGVCTAAAIGLVTTAAMLSVGLDPLGSTTYGLGLALLGLCYSAVALVAAQVSTSARGALGLTGAAIAVGYLVRGVGAMRDDALVWASPFGWAQRMDAFGTEQAWPALPLLALTAGLLALAARLTAGRDFGGGLLQTRPGRPRASRTLATPVGLAFRQQRGLVVGWAAGLTALGLVYGAVLPTIPDLAASNPDIASVIGASGDVEQVLVDAFLRYVFVFMAVVSTGFAVASVLRLRTEEESGRAELLLSTGTSRTAWVTATAAVTAFGILVIATSTGLGLAVGYALGSGRWDRLAAQIAGQLSYAPAVLLVGGVAFAVAGLLPRWSTAAWAVIAFVFVQVLLGDVLRLPDWVDAASPFWHLSQVPVDAFAPGPLLAEVALTAGLVLAGVWGYRRRAVVSG